MSQVLLLRVRDTFKSQKAKEILSCQAVSGLFHRAVVLGNAGV